jgi:hypothetical protein
VAASRRNREFHRSQLWPLLSRLRSPDEPVGRPKARRRRPPPPRSDSATAPGRDKTRRLQAYHPGLQGDAGVLQAPWWKRERLSDGASLPNGPGIYCIYERDADEPLYIGETSAIFARSATHAARSWSLSEPWLAVLPLADGTPKCVLHEVESDLLGWHFRRSDRAPVFQYRKARGSGVA